MTLILSDFQEKKRGLILLRFDITQLKGVILEIGTDWINTRILLDEPNIQNHFFLWSNAKFQKTKKFLTVEFHWFYPDPDPITTYVNKKGEQRTP